jgi:dephospho-CoA kinase
MTSSARTTKEPAIIGLTGGIASGKSTVAGEFARLGAAIVDADQLARDVVAPGTPALEEIRRRFGDEMILPDGSLDRKRLGALVFADAAARAAINAITHPRIAARSRDAISELARAGHAIVLYEAALIVENQLHHNMDALIVVSVPEVEQIKRLRERDGLSQEEALARIRAQKPLTEKTSVATYVVDNSGTLPATQKQVERIWQELQKRFGKIRDPAQTEKDH